MVSAFVLHTPQVFSEPLDAQKHYANEWVDICFQLGFSLGVQACARHSYRGSALTYSRSESNNILMYRSLSTFLLPSPHDAAS